MFKFTNTRKPDFKKIEKLDYNEYWRERGFSLNSKLKEREEIILNLVDKGSRIIDIGCGNSLLPVKLKEKSCEISVADTSSIVLDGFNEGGIEAVKMDLEKVDTISFAKKVDYIILSEVLEHTRNPEEIISRLSSFTKSFLITIPNSAFYRYRLWLMFSGRFFTQWVYHPSEHLRFWSHIDFLDWLDAMGLEVREVIASNGFSFFGLLPGLKNWWPNLFGHQIVYLCNVKESKN